MCFVTWFTIDCNRQMIEKSLRGTGYVRENSHNYEWIFDPTLRSGFWLRAPASLTPAKRLKSATLRPWCRPNFRNYMPDFFIADRIQSC